MFSGGDYAEVGRWLENFATSHAKRENPRVEAAIDMGGPRQGRTYGIRLALGSRVLPPADRPPLELSFAEAARERGGMAWCQTWGDRIAAMGRELTAGEQRDRKSA
jgi:hypothetical protein